MRKARVFAIVAVAAILSVGVSVSGPGAEEEMSAEMQKMMERWQEYMTPGDPHDQMKKTVGTWDYVTRWWQAPGTPAQESTGTAEFKMIMGGRYLVQHAEGPYMGQTFKGMGLTGYDNLKKKYQSMWIDNMGTGVMTSEGTCEGDVCTYYGMAPDVMKGEYKRVKSIGREISDDEMAFEMYDKNADGEWWKSFEIVYHRRDE